MAKIIMYPGEARKDTLDWKAVQGQHITAVKRNILVLGSGGREMPWHGNWPRAKAHRSSSLLAMPAPHKWVSTSISNPLILRR